MCGFMWNETSRGPCVPSRRSPCVVRSCSLSSSLSPPARVNRLLRPLSPASEPADAQDEQDLTGGVTQLASKLQDPRGLSTFGPSVFFTTTYGYATQAEASYNHDVWIKTGSARAKRLYKGLYGATSGMVATKNGLYEMNEGYASLTQLPLDGSNADGKTILHVTFDDPGDEVPGTGVRAFDADDDGLVVALRTEYDPAKVGDIVTLGPDGQNQKKIGCGRNVGREDRGESRSRRHQLG